MKGYQVARRSLVVTGFLRNPWFYKFKFNPALSLQWKITLPLPGATCILAPVSDCNLLICSPPRPITERGENQ